MYNNNNNNNNNSNSNNNKKGRYKPAGPRGITWKLSQGEGGYWAKQCNVL